MTAQGDAGPFPGTVWAATYGADSITVFEPGDYSDATCTGADDPGLDEDGDGFTNAEEIAAGSDPCNALSTPGGTSCTGADDAALDEDGDGFDNADEIAAGTDPCNGGSQPTDNDGDGTSDVTDTDDDGDGIPDVDDPFAIDATNGIGTTVPVARPLENEDPGTGFYGLGFTGLMTNGTDTWLDQFDDGNLAAGGAVGALTVEEVPPGDAYTDTNTQEYAFQYGVDVDDASAPFVVHTQVESPFFASGGGTQTPANYQSNGLFIGSGSQDDYLKLVFGGNGGPTTQVLLESGGAVDVDQKYGTGVTGDWLAANQVDLQLVVDPAALTAQPRTSLDGGSTWSDLGTPVALPAAWFDGSDDLGLAVGIISTSNGSTPFGATWDFLDVDTVGGGGGNTAPAISGADDVSVTEGETAQVVVDVADADGDALAVDVGSTPDASAFLATDLVENAAGDYTLTLDLAPGAGDAGSYDVTVEADDGTDTTSATLTATVDQPVVQEDVLYRVNVGGDQVAAADGSAPDWGSDSDAAPSAFRVAGGANTYAASSGSAHPGAIDLSDASLTPGVPVDVLEVERWDPEAAPEMLWQFPVDAGTEVEVRLFFAELFGGVDAAGERVFDVSVEGSVPAAFDDIDQFDTAGAKGAFMRSSTAIVEGDTLDVEFLHDVIENPAVKGIEVVRVAPPGNLAPTIDPIDDVTVAEGDSEVVSITASDPDGDDVALDATGLPDFATFDPGTGEFTLAPVTGDAAGSPYTITITADDGNGGMDSVDVAVDVTEPTPAPDPVAVDTFTYGEALFRVNAGGPEVAAADGGVAWESDLEDAESSYLTDAYLAGADNQKNTSSVTVTPTVDATVPTTTPGQVFQTERWDPPAGIEMSWLFPVADGTPVEVRLHFADYNGPTQSAGARVFDVAIEGTTVLDDFDIFDEAGADTGTMRAFVATADADGLGIDLTRVVENPEIRAIEIVELVDATEAEPGADVGFVTRVTNPDTNTGDATVQALELAVDGSGAVDVSGDCAPAAGEAIAPGAGSVCRFTNTVQGSPDEQVTHEVTVTVDFSTGETGVATTSDPVVVTLAEASPIVARINAGGGAIAATDPGGPDWVADDVAGSGPFLAVPSGSSLGGFSVPDRTDDVQDYVPQAVYQTERWDGTNGAAPDDLTWEIPVEPGASVTVNLFMANGWDGTDQPGEREFDVFIEEVLALDEFDLTDTYGHATGGVESFPVVDDGDGLLSIILEHGVGPQNPLVNAIEVRTD